MMDWELYKSKLYALGDTPHQRQITQAKDDFYREAIKNPAYHKALRNGVEQDFLITRSETPEKYKIVAFPDDELNVGDEIEVFGEHWIVYQVRVENTLQKNGIIWLCNHKFRWQNFSPTIIEKWGVLDSGVYSTTIKGEAEVRYKDKQFKIILPLDDETKKLYIDKRLAVDKVYDRFENEILNVYKITGYDSVGESFGAGGHLLILNIRSDEFNRETDNINELLCDYISGDNNNEIPDGLLSCYIEGKNKIRVGSKRIYTAYFETENIGSVVAKWDVIVPDNSITYLTNDSTLTILIPDKEELIGKSIKIRLTDKDGAYSTDEITVDIVGL